jgi:hypothetical protein
MDTMPATYTPTPLPAAEQPPALLLPSQPMTVGYVPAPDGSGRMIATYVPVGAVTPAPPSILAAPAPAPVTVIQAATPAFRFSPLAANAFLGAGAFALTCLGLHLLAAVIEALAQLMTALVWLAAVLCGAPLALNLARALFSTGHGRATGPAPQTVIHARKVRIGRLINKG